MDRQRDSRQRQSGFTLIELLIVVAIIGIIAATAIPQLQRAMLRSRISRLENDAMTLFKGFVQFQIDKSTYPSTSTPANMAFNRATLEPLVSNAYIRTADAILATLRGKRVTDYDSPNVGMADAEFYAVLTLAAMPSIQIVIGDTDQFPGFVGQHIQGGYFIYGNALYSLDTDILKLMGK